MGFIKEIQGFSIQELTNLNQEIVRLLKLKRGMVGMQVATKLNVGDVVKVNHPKAIGNFTIKKIKRTRATCTNDKGISYNVPFSLIEV